MTEQQHQAVLLDEVLEHLKIRTDGCYIDATFGRGGHSSAILASLGSNGSLLAIDRDPEAIRVGSMLQDHRFKLIYTEFSNLGSVAQQLNLNGRVDGVIFDLGVSSPQLDTPARGFSFLNDGPLDMRMNPNSTGLSAAQWLAQAPEDEIAQVLYQLGDERYARRIARAITTARQHQPIERTSQLAAIVSKANPAWERDKHPATRSFLAIRSHINEELSELSAGLEAALKILAIGGRLLVISFHSLEDRIVKRFFRQEVRGDNLPRKLPVLASELRSRLQLITTALRPQQAEIDRNVRSRSAILRVAEKIG